MKNKNVLNAGYVRLIEWMGGDQAVIRNARRCWRSEDRSSPKSDRNLIHHLLRKRHMTPFEATVFTFDVKVPIFVARQWLRHRMASPMELSLRYCVADREYYIPQELFDCDKEATRHDEDRLEAWKIVNDNAFSAYEDALSWGLPKEQARSLLPVGIYTQFYWTVNGSSLMNFLRLRIDKGAQAEIREYAKAILEMVSEIAPMSFEAFKELVLEEDQ